MSAQRTELLFLDSKVENFPDLAGGRAPGVEVHLLHGETDGLSQIAGVLAGRRDIDALHVISHGAEASIELGAGHVTAEALNLRHGELARIGAALKPGGDILVYGCEVGAGDAGAAFVEALRAATAANVAASTNLTGAARLAGDWALARTAGDVATRMLQFPDYDGVLASVAGTVGASGQVNGSNFGAVFVDGEGGSTDILGIQYNLFYADSSDNPLDLVHYVSTFPLPTLAPTFEGNPARFIISSAGGEEFDLSSFYHADNYGINLAWTVTGYRDNVQIGSQNYTIDQFGDFNKTVTLSSDFNNVDKVVITAAGGQIYSGFNTFVFGDPPDTTPPTVSVAVSDNNLLAGETSLVTFTFSEAVTGFTNADLTIANGTLSAVSSSDGGITWTATLTPTASVTDATNVITVDKTGVVDAASNPGVGSTNSNNYAVATVRPTASIVVADNTLSIGETSLTTITFSEAVTGFSNADLTIANGTLSAVSSSDGGVTWTATFTPTASVTDATNVITLANTGVTNGAGNTGAGTTDSNNYAIDTARPTASIVVADAALRIGETSLTTITFSEAVTGFTNADLTIANGTLSAVSSSDGGITWTATFTPTASITDTTNLITLDNTGVADAAGNAGSGTTDSNNYAVDTVRPTASIVVAETALKAGETSLVTVTFSEAVSGFTNADLTIANGSMSAVSSSDGGITWTATFTPTASLTDATNVITLNDTGVSDLAGNAGSGTTDSGNYAIDTARPTASIVVADASLSASETSLVTFTFSEAVTGFTNADLTIANGTLSAVSSSDGGITWTASLTPTASVSDATNLITLDNTGVSDAAGNAGTGTTDSNNYAIGVTTPTASIVVADAALKIGETSLVTFTFSEAVSGFTNADLTIANGTLSAVSSSDGGITWTATLTPAASVADATNLITVNNTGVTSVATSNAGVGTSDSNNYAIDTVRPTAAIVVADASLTAGETSGVTITFSEAVTGFTNADLTIANGALSAVTSGDGGITWTATLTPTASLVDATNLLTLDNTGVSDSAGNAGVGTTDSNNYAIDTTPAPEPVTPPTTQPGTAGADSITGDSQDNTIATGDGADLVSAGAGADTVSGGDGDDVLQGNIGADSIAGGVGADVVYGGQDDDVLQGNTGADGLYGDKGSDTLAGGQDNDLVQGGLDRDHVSGDKGDDIVRGGQGDDVVLGGDGNDYVSGDLGSDTMTGGSGADLFHSFGAAGLDRITDFNRAEGDRLMLEPGTTYTLAQIGADTVINMGGGGQVILANVQLSSLSGDWIFGA